MGASALISTHARVSEPHRPETRPRSLTSAYAPLAQDHEIGDSDPEVALYARPGCSGSGRETPDQRPGPNIWHPQGEFNPKYTRTLECRLDRRLTRNAWSRTYDRVLGTHSLDSYRRQLVDESTLLYDSDLLKLPVTLTIIKGGVFGGKLKAAVDGLNGAACPIQLL